MKKLVQFLWVFSVWSCWACSQQGASQKSTASSSKRRPFWSQKKTDASSSEVKEKEKKKRKKEVKKMDLEVIANGDYSSIAGVWQDDKGKQASL